MGRKSKNARPRQCGRRIHLNKYIAQRGKTKMNKAKRRAFEQMENQAVGTITVSPEHPYAFKTDRRSSNLYPRQYEIWFAELGYHYGTSIQGGCRPVLIVSNDVANRFSRTLTVIPLTTKMKRLDMPTHVPLTEDDCEMLRAEYLLDSLLLAEQVATIDKSMLHNRLCRIKSAEKIAAVKAALDIQLGEADGQTNSANNENSIETRENRQKEVNTSGS